MLISAQTSLNAETRRVDKFSNNDRRERLGSGGGVVRGDVFSGTIKAGPCQRVRVDPGVSIWVSGRGRPETLSV